MHSYASLFAGLLPGVCGSAHLGAQLQPIAGSGTLSDLQALSSWLRDCGWLQSQGVPIPIDRSGGGTHQVAFPLVDSSGKLLAAVCIDLAPLAQLELGARIAEAAASRLRPALDCLHRELSSLPPPATTDDEAADRTADLEWLFHVAEGLQRSGGEWLALRHLLASACTRIGCSLGLLFIPDKQLSLIHEMDTSAATVLRPALTKIQPHVFAWTTRRKEALLVNAPSPHLRALAPARMLAVPVCSPSGRVIGVLAFFRSFELDAFTERHRYLAGHLTRQVTPLVESQFDIATGLPTRASLEQSFEQRCKEASDVIRSIVYIDIDALHVCNEKHGFELGDELIVRIADLLTSDLVPDTALVGRISGDRFAVVLEHCDPREARHFTSTLQQAAERIAIGPTDDAFDVSVSCGIAALVEMPKGFSRALAAAEVACKSAKDRGRNRTELYACEDTSMMRRHGDVLVVGKLREAIRKETLILYAQRIVRLDRERSLAGFEVLLRWHDPTGKIVLPDQFMSAAQRYQLLPQIDRYVVRQTLAQLVPYRSLLLEMRATASINVSAQSLGDESFIKYLLEELRTSNVAPGLITCEITEQTAVASLAKSADMMRQLRLAGCRVALDDFGVGANTFAYLKALPATRIKIDGSFVKDMLTNARSAAMVKSLADLARAFRMDCVAEYVESEALAKRLQTMGIEYAQGYAFGRPEPLDGLLQQLRSEESQRLRAYWLEN